MRFLRLFSSVVFLIRGVLRSGGCAYFGAPTRERSPAHVIDAPRRHRRDLRAGGSNEQSNLAVAKQLIKIMGLEDQEASLISFVPDRAFNDLRYTIDNSALEALGWKELMPWEEGLKRTVEWYKTYSVRYANIEQALVAHPRIESAVSAI